MWTVAETVRRALCSTAFLAAVLMCTPAASADMVVSMSGGSSGQINIVDSGAQYHNQIYMGIACTLNATHDNCDWQRPAAYQMYDDSGAPMYAVAPCQFGINSGGPVVDCPLSATSVSASLNAGNDDFVTTTGIYTGVPMNIPVWVDGGADSDFIDLYGQAGGNTILGGSGLIDELDGTSQSDVIDGGSGEDIIRGEGGVDILTGGGDAATDSIDGGTNNDTIDGGPGGDVLSDPSGTNTINGGTSSYNDTITGGSGRDTINAGAGNDQIIGGADVDTINGEAGIDTIYGGSSGDTINGGNDNDTIYGEDGADTIRGELGADTIYGGAGNDPLLDGGWNADTIHGEQDNDTIYGGDGNFGDVLEGNNGQDAIDGGLGNDTIDGGQAKDTLQGGEGSDIIHGGDGNDDIDGGPGFYEDWLYGELNDDTLKGGDGPDHLYGNAHSDTLLGEAGNDELDGGNGQDEIDGGGGTDTTTYAGRSEDLKVTLGNSSYDDGGSQDGGVGARDRTFAVENVVGGDGNDWLIGDGSTNDLKGGAGDDTLDGGFGNDQLRGDGGSDWVDYHTRTAAVNVVLTGGGGQSSVGEGDGYTSIENARGGNGDDELTGSSSGNVLEGWGGSDKLTGGAGADFLRGNGVATATTPAPADGRFDEVSYSDHSAKVTANLDGLANDGSAGEGDQIAADVEHITGGSGNDTLTGNSKANQLRGGGGNDTLDGGLNTDYLEGGAGNGDLVTYGNRTNKVWASADGFADDGETLEFDNIATDVEILVGGAGNDELTGSNDPSVGDMLIGNGGNDALDGQMGPDVMFGDNPFDPAVTAGSDTVTYETRTNPVLASLGDSVPDGEITALGFENDFIYGDVESLVGGSAGDDLTGADQPNRPLGVLAGRGGNDYLHSGRGPDVLAGGDGNDGLYYNGARTKGVAVRAGDWNLDGESGEGDLVLGDIEAVHGTGFTDFLTTGTSASSIYGEGSLDVMIGSNSNSNMFGGAGGDFFLPAAGAEYMDGQSGEDAIDYWGFALAANISLDGQANDGQFGLDNVVRMTYLRGTDQADEITGDSANNYIYGMGGNDILRGGDGNDRIYAGPGEDRLFGEGGFDWLFSDDDDGSAGEVNYPQMQQDEVNCGPPDYPDTSYDNEGVSEPTHEDWADIDLKDAQFDGVASCENIAEEAPTEIPDSFWEPGPGDL